MQTWEPQDLQPKKLKISTKSALKHLIEIFGYKNLREQLGTFRKFVEYPLLNAFSEMLNVHKENNPSQKPHNILLPHMVM